MMSSEFLFSFLMFFPSADRFDTTKWILPIDSRKNTLRLAEEINEIQSDKEVQEVLKLTGLKVDDFREFQSSLWRD